MDPLSDVLRSVRLMGGVFVDASFTAPWSIAAQITTEDCEPFFEIPGQVICYHVVTEGSMLLSVGDEAPVEVRAGEIVLLPRNDPHTMASEAGLTPVNAGELLQPSVDGGMARINHGGGGERTNLVCGFLGSEGGYNPLIAALPTVLTLDIREGMLREWVEASVRFAANELALGRLASSNVMSRLSETLFVEAVRQYSSSLSGKQAGWLNGLNDPQIARALLLLHRDIAAPWSADSLAKEVALSRSAFMDRFKSVIGVPPIRYLTMWRLETAKLQLRESDKPAGQIAHLVGYESEAAFSRAFKREFGLSPSQWREQGANAAIKAV